MILETVFNKKVKMLLCFVLLLSSISLIQAQESTDWYYNKVIKNIKFEGLFHIKSSDLDGVTNSFLGKEFTDDLYSELLNRIYELEYFTDDIVPKAVPYNEEKTHITLIFTVTELPYLAKIKFEGNKKINDATIKESISLKQDSIFQEKLVLLDERVIRDLYLEKGYTNIKVSSKKELVDNTVILTFIVEEGKPTIVKSINFEGNYSFSAKTLKSELTLKEQKLFNKGAFQESTLEMDKQALTLYYQNKGYVDFQIVDIKRSITFNEKDFRDEISLTFVLKEGSVYKFTGLTLEGNKIFSTEELLEKVTLKVDDVFNQTKFQESLMAIIDLYQENGYFNNFTPQQIKDTELHTIGYILKIVERNRAHIENIFLRGNEKTKDYVILRELPIESGDIYSKTKIQNGYRNIYNLQFFKSVLPDVQQGSEENLVDLIIEVEEQSTTQATFGFVFSGVDSANTFPVSLNMGITDTNFIGTGMNVGANIELSPDAQTFSVKYQDNWFLNQPIAIGIEANIAHEDLSTLQYMYFPEGINSTTYYMNYDNLSYGLNVSLGRRWTPEFAIFLWNGGYSFKREKSEYDQNLYTPVDTTISDNLNKWGVTNAIWTKISTDDRDLNYDPSKGWFASQQLTWTGFIPSVENQFYLKSDTKIEGYLPLFSIHMTEDFDFKMIAAGYSGLTFLVPAEGYDIGLSNLLYIDGMFNGRGWTTLRYNRGQAMWSNHIELRSPIVAGIVAADLFLDSVIIKDDLTSLSELALDDFYFSYGFAARISMPQLPLVFVWAIPFKFNNGVVEWKNTTMPHGQFVLSFNITNK